MANLITLGRLVLFFFTLGLIYTRSLPLVLLAAVLIMVVITSDALDGWVARYRGSTSDFGSVADIAGDRVVEQCAWIVFAHLGLIGVWAPLMVVTRGVVVDITSPAWQECSRSLPTSCMTTTAGFGACSSSA